MADKSNLIITSADYMTGNTQQKTITDINPVASNSDLKSWSEMTGELSKDTYIKARRVDVTDLDGAGHPRTFTDFTATFVTGNAVTITDTSSYSASSALANVYTSSSQKCCQFFATTTLDAPPQIRNYSTTGTAPDKIAELGYNWSTNSSYRPGSWDFRVYLPNEAATTTFTLHFDATTTSDAFDMPFTLTVTADE